VPTPSFEGSSAERAVAVTGTASALKSPDTAYLDVRFVTQGPDAATAACANERAIAALRAQLPAAQIADAPVFFSGAQTVLARTPPPPAGSSAAPSAAPRWISSRLLRIVTAPGAELQNAAKAAVASQGTLDSLRYGVTDREPAYQDALRSAIRDAMDQARSVAASQHLQAGRLVRIEVAAIEPSSVGQSIAPGPALDPAARVDPIAVHASVRAVFPLVTSARTGGHAAALIVLHPFGLVSRLPEIASVNVEFSDRGNDRTALLYRQETAYDALWGKLRALGIQPSQVPISSPQIVANRRAEQIPPEILAQLPRPPGPIPSPTPFVAYSLSRQVHVNAVPVAQLPAVIAAFAGAGATSADVTFSVIDRASAVAAANTALHQNASALAKTVASAAGLRLVEPPYFQTQGYPAIDASIFRTPLGSPDQPRRFEPPARLSGFLTATVVYAGTR